jgi:hypothetical protein
MFFGVFTNTLYEINLTHLARCYGGFSISNSTKNNRNKIFTSIRSKIIIYFLSLINKYFCKKKQLMIDIKNKKDVGNRKCWKLS